MARCGEDEAEALAAAIEVQMKLVDLAADRAKVQAPSVPGAQGEYRAAVKKLKELQAKLLQREIGPGGWNDCFVREPSGRWIGRLEWRENRLVFLDRQGFPIGHFDPGSNVTRDDQGRVIGRGNRLKHLAGVA